MGNTERLSSLNGLRQMPKEQEEESAVPNVKTQKNDYKVWNYSVMILF